MRKRDSFSELPPLSRGRDGAFHERATLVQLQPVDRKLSEETARELIVLMPQEVVDEGDSELWRVTTNQLRRRKALLEQWLAPIEIELIVLERKIQEDLQRENMLCSSIDLIALRNWKELQEPLDKELDGILRELDRRDVLERPISMN